MMEPMKYELEELLYQMGIYLVQAGYAVVVEAAALAVEEPERLQSLTQEFYAAMFLFLAGLYAMGMETLPGYPLNNNQYYAIASAGHVGLFYLVRITIAGLTGSLAAVFALTVSSFLSNSYVALLAPLLGFYTSQVLHSLLIPRLSAFRLDSVFFYQPIAGSASFSFLWSAVYLLTLTALCARLFLWRLRKEAGE